jgi:hypothetical protein
VDVRTSYWSDGAARKADKEAVLAYMAQEMGKASQKSVPYGFGRVTHFWGLFGRDLGLRPSFEFEALDGATALALGAEMEQWMRDRIVAFHTPETAAELLAWRDRRQEFHGVEAVGLYGEVLAGLRRRAEDRVALSRADIDGSLDAGPAGGVRGAQPPGDGHDEIPETQGVRDWSAPEEVL